MRLWGVVLAVLIGAAWAAPAAQADVRWLCTPAVADDPCDDPLVTTVEAPDRSRTQAQTPRPARAPVDCFYVYPTVSNQPGPNATQTPDPEVVSIAQLQAARFSQRCRVFVPIYRQVTVPGIFAGGFTPESLAVAYGDVREAFDAYLREDNDGRGIVLIGHSQGTGHLRRLIAETFDVDPLLRRRLVAAYLLGGNVLTRQGSDRGGDFQRVRLCTDGRQTGCVVAYSIFDEPPPPDARFGRVPATDRLTGQTPPPQTEVACTNPASLAANDEAQLRPILRGEPFAPGLIAAGVLQTFGGVPPGADTPYLEPADRYRARCVRDGGANVLRVATGDGARVLNPSPDATWGLHLTDVNLALGNLVDLLSVQTRRFLAPRVTVRARSRFQGNRACRAPLVRVTVAGAVRGIRVRAGRRVAVRSAAPFRVLLRVRPGVVNRLRIGVVGTDDRTRLVTRRVRAC